MFLWYKLSTIPMESIHLPLSVRITQVILLTASIVFLVLLTISALYENLVLWSVFVPGTLLFVLPLTAFIALARRSAAGRWLAMMSLLCVAAFMARWFNGFFGAESSPAISSILSNGKLLAIFIFIVSTTALFFVLFLRIGFSTRATRYFDSLGKNPIR
jgi:hypothetical protein